jgi:hypothetical protein
VLPSPAQRADRDPKTGRFAEGNPFRWTKGRSGNPNGRPRGIKATFAQAFDELAAEDERFKEGPVVVAKALILEALRRDGRHKVQACREVLDRSVGKVPQPFRIALPDEDEDRASFTDLRVRVMTREDVERERKNLLISGNGDDPSEDDVPE